MRKTKYLNLKAILFILFLGGILFSCTKEKNEPIRLSEPIDKQAALVGKWQQTDVVLAVDVDKSSGLISNASVVANAYLIELGLGISGFGRAMTFSQYNALIINADGSYSIENPVSTAFSTFLMPGAGTAGKWAFDNHIGVLQLTPDGATEIDPHWVDKVTNTDLTLSLLLNAGGQDIPLYVKYKKITGEEEDLTAQRTQLLEGNWYQKDIQFAMTIPEDALGLEIPEGTSLIEMAPLLAIALGDPDLAQQIQLTGLNTFSFAGGNYNFSNPLDNALVKFLLPDAGTSGGSQIIASGNVIGFLPSGESTPDVHVIKQLDENTFSFSVNITVPGAGTLPFNLILARSAGVTAAQKMQELAGTWKQKDLVFAIDIPADALGFPIPAGTSLMALADNPAIASQLDPDVVMAIKLMTESVYSFGTNGVYSFTNPVPQVIEALFPKAKGDGQWALVGGDHLVLPLFHTSSPELHWVNYLNTNESSIRVTLEVDGLPIPLNLILSKQNIDPNSRSAWIPGTWGQQDLQLGIDIPANQLFPGQPALPGGTSLLSLVQDPNIAAVLGAQFVGAIQATALSTYVFDGGGTYAFNNPASAAVIEMLFSNAGLSGDWSFTAGATGLKLQNGSKSNVVRIVDMTEKTMTIGTMLNDGKGLEIPVNLLLKK